MKIKPVPGHSAGTVVAYYLTSSEPNCDDIDFEFLGHVAGQPYILQTNVITEGFSNREQNINLWFDPTKDFHTDSIHWSIHQLIFMVDWVPIRTYRNHADKGVIFPKLKPMTLKVTLWKGDSWATGGGSIKIDWTKGPFIALFRNYNCIWKGDLGLCNGDDPTRWWSKINTLTSTQIC